MVAHPTVTFYPEGEMPAVVAPGDFLLVRSDAPWHSRNGFVDGMIRLGQRMILAQAGVEKEQRTELARWSHAVAVADGTLIEAVGRGVVRSPLDRYAGKDFLYVHTDLSAEQRHDCTMTWERLVGVKYGFLTDVSIGATALTGANLTVKFRHQCICSGLVCAGLGIYQWRDDPSFVMPAQLAMYHGIDGHIPDA